MKNSFDVKGNCMITENTSYNKQIVEEVKNTVYNIDEMFSSLFDSINILETSEEIFEIVKRINTLSDSIKEIKELCEEVEYNCKKEDSICKCYYE